MSRILPYRWHGEKDKNSNSGISHFEIVSKVKSPRFCTKIKFLSNESLPRILYLLLRRPGIILCRIVPNFSRIIPSPSETEIMENGSRDEVSAYLRVLNTFVIVIQNAKSRNQSRLGLVTLVLIKSPPYCLYNKFSVSSRKLRAFHTHDR